MIRGRSCRLRARDDARVGRAPSSRAALGGHILAPTSLSAEDRAAGRLALQLAQARQARITFLRILPRATFPPPLDGLDAFERLHLAVWALRGVDPARSAPWCGDAWRAEVREFVSRELSGRSGGNLDVRSEIRTGDAAREIVRFAEETAVDLVVLPTRGFWGLPLLPGRAQRVLKRTRVPVLLVRPDVDCAEAVAD